MQRDNQAVDLELIRRVRAGGKAPGRAGVEIHTMVKYISATTTLLLDFEIWCRKAHRLAQRH